MGIWAVSNSALGKQAASKYLTVPGVDGEGRTYRVQAAVHDPKSCRRIKFKSAELARSCLAAFPLESRPSC